MAASVPGGQGSQQGQGHEQNSRRSQQIFHYPAPAMTKANEMTTEARSMARAVGSSNDGCTPHLQATKHPSSRVNPSRTTARTWARRRAANSAQGEESLSAAPIWVRDGADHPGQIVRSQSQHGRLLPDHQGRSNEHAQDQGSGHGSHGLIFGLQLGPGVQTPQGPPAVKDGERDPGQGHGHNHPQNPEQKRHEIDQAGGPGGPPRGPTAGWP